MTRRTLSENFDPIILENARWFVDNVLGPLCDEVAGLQEQLRIALGDDRCRAEEIIERVKRNARRRVEHRQPCVRTEVPDLDAQASDLICLTCGHESRWHWDSASGESTAIATIDKACPHRGKP